MTASLRDIFERQRAALERKEGISRLSNTEIGQRAAPYNDGVNIHWGTIGKYLRGNFSVLRPEKLVALARVLATEDCSASQLFAEMQEARGMPPGAGVTWDFPVEIYLLNSWKRSLVEDLIRGLALSETAAQQKVTDEEDAEPADG